MAKTRDYMDYLDSEIGIAPANSQEELQAAETIADVMKDHGLEPTIQEFDTHPAGEMMPNVLGLVLFAGVLLSGLGGAVRVIGLMLAIAAAVLLLVLHNGNNVFRNLGPTEKSQNVIGVHRAMGDRVVKGARPIVIVAHYDTPRENYLYGPTFARYQSNLYKAIYPCVVIATVIALTQVFGFLPVVARVVLWIVGLVACVPVVVVAVANIMERFSGCTTGSNDNKASVAAMLSIMSKVRPGEDRVDAAAEGKPYTRRASEETKPETRQVLETPVGVRHGKEVLESLGMLPPACEIVYEEPKLVTVEVTGEGQPVGEPGTVSTVSEPGAPAPSVPSEDGATVGGESAPSGPAVPQSDGTAPVTSDGSDRNPNALAETSQEIADDDEYYTVEEDVPDQSQAQTASEAGAPASDAVVADRAHRGAGTSPDDTLRGTRSGGKGGSRAGSSGSKKTKGWFARLRERFSRKDKEEPVSIARGRNKAADQEDYSQYETSYAGDDEIEEWSTGETEELRPLRSGDMPQRSDQAAEDSRNHPTPEDGGPGDQTLGDIYGQFDEEDGATDQERSWADDDSSVTEADQDWADADYADYEDDDTGDDATDFPDDSVEVRTAPGEDVDGTPSDEIPAEEAGEATATATDANETSAAEAERESEATSSLGIDDASDHRSPEMTTAPEDDGTASAADAAEPEIPESIHVDTVPTHRARMRKAGRPTSEGGAPVVAESQADQAGVVDGTPTDETAPAATASYEEDGLSWDQPSVEDEEYEEDYPADAAVDDTAGWSSDGYDDEYYIDEPYDDAADVEEYGDEAGYDETYPGSYEPGEESPYQQGDAGSSNHEGAVRRFARKVKGLFTRKKSEAQEQEYGYVDESVVDDAGSYDETDEGAMAAGGYQGQGAQAGDQVEEDSAQRGPAASVEFREVRSEEYLPSDEDAIYDDLDDDYDFSAAEDEGDGSSGARNSSDADAVIRDRSARMQFDGGADDTGDILPKDTIGLDTTPDDYADQRQQRTRTPRPIDDPSWGKSSYEPPISPSSIARRAALLDLPNPSSAPSDPLASDDEYGDDEGQDVMAPPAAKSSNAALDDTQPDGTPIDADAGVSPDEGPSAEGARNRRSKWKGGAAVRSDMREDEAPQDIDVTDPEDVVDTTPSDEVVDAAAEAQLPDEAPEANAAAGVQSVTDEDLQDAIMELGDDLLISHDIWFVAVGASSVGHAGIKSFLANFRRDIRGAFLVNLDSVGAGAPVVLAREGLDKGRRSDRRSMRLFESTAKDLHLDVQNIDYGWKDTDATPAMRSRVRSITVMGMDENGLPALSHTLNDVPMNVDPKQVSAVVRTVCEFIRRS